jgi:hypothetical protein
MTQLPNEDRQAAVNQLRAQTLRDRLLILQHDAIVLAEKIGTVRDFPNEVTGTSRREMQLRVAETDLASASKFIDFFLSDIAKAP